MAADPVVLCLQAVTDYTQFERLCNDLMVLEGYDKLEPLGGFKDSGRDAVLTNSIGGQKTIFAYSVREDWRVKLDEDAKKIRGHRHPCDRLVFLTTAEYTPGERDKAVKEIQRKYKWPLELYGVERLGTLVRSRYRHLIRMHPAIFTPAYFPPVIAGVDPQAQDFVFIDYVEADADLALWLARRLMACGYRAWCRAFSLLAGERPAEAMEQVIRNHACRVISLYSPDAVRDPDTLARRAVARAVAAERGSEFFVPVTARAFDRGRLDYQTRDQAFVPFDLGWADGIRQLLMALEARTCPRPFVSSGPGVAAQTFVVNGLIRRTPERVFSNCFPVRRIPEVIRSFDSRVAVTRERRLALRNRWAFRDVSPTRLVSFHTPPDDIKKELGLSAAGSCCWADVRE